MKTIREVHKFIKSNYSSTFAKFIIKNWREEDIKDALFVDMDFIPEETEYKLKKCLGRWEEEYKKHYVE